MECGAVLCSEVRVQCRVQGRTRSADINALYGWGASVCTVLIGFEYHSLCAYPFFSSPATSNMPLDHMPIVWCPTTMGGRRASGGW